MTSVPDIKLIRTDTTLDLSQKAEKVCPFQIQATSGRIMLLADMRLYV